jgi:hypothetical protein
MWSGTIPQVAAQARCRQPGLRRRLLKRARIPLILHVPQRGARRDAAGTTAGNPELPAGAKTTPASEDNAVEAAEKSGADYT